MLEASEVSGPAAGSRRVAAPRVPWIRDPDDPARALAFYLGAHRPRWLECSPVPLFVSFATLAAYRRHGENMPQARCCWALDSGGFTELQRHGRWTWNYLDYGAAVVRLIEDCGAPPAFVAPQDWMCEPWVITGGVHGRVRFAGTGLDVLAHQHLTVENFCLLREEFASCVPWIPVLQGWTLGDYLRCVELYRQAGVDLAAEPLVGLGSVCRRQSTAEIAAIVGTLAGLGLRLHAFGVKRAGLAQYGPQLASADSLAWSYGARPWRGQPGRRGEGCTHPGPCNNCLTWALQWRDETLASLRRPHQLGIELVF